MLSKSDLISFAATGDTTKSRQFYEETLGPIFVSADQFALVFNANRTMLRIQKVDNFTPHRYTVLGWRVGDIK